MAPFEPVGNRSRRNIALDTLRLHAEDDLVTYDELAEALELDPVLDRDKIQSAVRAAARNLLQADKLALEPVVNQGYRIVTAEEHLRLARGFQRSSSRALVRGHAVISRVDYNQLSPDVRALAEVTMQAFSMQIDFNRRLDVRQAKLEKAMAAVANKTDDTADDVAALRERLARLEEKLGGAVHDV